MFTVEFAAGVCLGYDTATARATTLRKAVDFAAAFAPNGCGVIVSDWVEPGGRQVVEVYDWCACCCPDPPVIAWVTASPGAVGE